MVSRHASSRLQFFLTIFLTLAVSAPTAAGESRWWMRQGEGDPLCETLYRELQKHRPEDLGSCTGSVVLALPGIKEPGGWKDLDPRDHKELFKKLLQYQALGARAYFGNWPEDAELRRIDQEGAKRNTLDDQTLEKRYQNFLAVGGRMRVKTLQLFRYPWGRVPDITYEQPQTLLEFRTKWYRTDCPKSPSLNDAVRTFYVTSDLIGPDPRIGDGERSRAYFARIVEYKNSVYLMATGPTGGITLDRDHGDGELRPFCEIQRRYGQP